MDRETYWALLGELDRLYDESVDKLHALATANSSDYIGQASCIGEQMGLTKARTVLRIAYQAKMQEAVTS